jgi:thioredoxin 1
MIHCQPGDPRIASAYFETGRALVEFYAKWCGTCRALTRTLQTVEPIIGVPVVCVDVEATPDLAARFGILGVPQLLYLKDGVVAGRIAGSLDESEFAEWFASLPDR